MSGPARAARRPPATCPLGDLLAERGRCATTRTGTRVTYSPKVFIPLTMLCRDQCGYCTFAQPPARLESPYLTPDAGARHRPRRRRGRLPRGAVHARRAARGALPGGPRSGSTSTATPPRSTTSPPWRSSCSTRPACSPTPTPARSTADELAPLRTGRAQPGDDDRVARRRPRLPPRLAGQGARAPPGHARGRRRARASRSPPGILVGIGEARGRPHRGARGHRRQPPPPRPRAGGDRPELPAEGRHRDARARRRARPTTTSRPSRWPG